MLQEATANQQALSKIKQGGSTLPLQKILIAGLKPNEIIYYYALTLKEGPLYLEIIGFECPPEVNHIKSKKNVTKIITYNDAQNYARENKDTIISKKISWQRIIEIQNLSYILK